jgi:hypothetical protein
MSIDWNVIVAIVQVIGTVGGLMLVWWKVTQIREVNAYELLRDEARRFNSPEMRVCRARLAKTLLSSPGDFQKIEDDGEEVCGYFEDVGGLLRRRIVPAYWLWSMHGDDILHYWQLLRDYVQWVRKPTGDQTYYEDFELLWKRLAALARKRSHVEPVFTEDQLREFLEGEAQLTASAARPRRRRRTPVKKPTT